MAAAPSGDAAERPAQAPPDPAIHAPTRRRARRTALWAVLLVGLAPATMLQNWSDNQSSHYDLIRALDAGRTTIDYGPYPTKDKAFYRGHWYSARAPGLAIYSLPFYELLTAVEAPALARESPALRGEDEMIDFVGLWGTVLPALLLALLVWRVAERFEPGYGAITAVIVGLGTMLLPFSTLLFSHVFSAMLGFAAFALMLRERDGPPRPLLLGLAGLLMGYAIGSEYPLAFVAVVLGLYLLSRRDAFRAALVAQRAGAYVLGAAVGIVPLLLYNHAAFHSWTHLAYSNIPQQHRGFFGISAPSPRVLATLLFDSRGLLTLCPVLVMGALGTVLAYRRGRRAEALTVLGVCVCYLGYNSGYYLPFGGGSMGPRFLITLVPFLGFPIALALRRWAAPTVALGGASIAIAAVATITHPLVGYETETVVWARLLGQGFFQPTIASAFGAGRGWGAIWPFLLVLAAALVLAARATPPLRLSGRALAGGALALGAWALFAALAPTLLGIDHAGLESIVKAGDAKALSKGFGDYPLRALAPIAAAFGALLLLAIALGRDEPREPRAAGRARRGRRTGAAVASLLALTLIAAVPPALARTGARGSGRPVAASAANTVPAPLAASRGASRTRARAAHGFVALSHACRAIEARDGPLRLAPHRHSLTVLATGDSMIYPVSEVLARGLPRGMRVVSSRHDGTGLTTSVLDWRALSRRDAARVRPDVTVITLGGRDGGIPLPGAQGQLTECCGPAWLALYAARARPLAGAYLRGGAGRVYWLSLPAPREAARAPLFAAVNDAIRLLASELGAPMRALDVGTAVSPGGFRATITYDGVRIHPRAPDGIHLSHDGACVERSLVVAALRADGLLRG